MKLLVALSIGQALLLALLGLKILAMDSRMHDLANSAEALHAQAERAGKAPRISAAFPQNGANLDEIRQVVREEVAAFGGYRPQANTQSAPAAQDAPVARDVDSVQLEKSVRQDLDYYMSKGSISEVEMADLEQRMARLPPAQRTQMLRKLTKAMASGDIEGRL